MTNEILLIYPTLDLFLYDLRKGLGQSDEKLNQKRRNFWQKVYGEELDDKLLKDLAKAERENATFVYLHKENGISIGFEKPLDGYYCPLQLGDMFALQVDCSGQYADDKNTPNDNPQPISSLSKIKNEINNQIQGNIQGTIGQTWMVYAQLSEYCTPNQLEEVAKQCYQELEPNGNWESDFNSQGKFLGANVFELWRFSDDAQDNYHLLIWLFPTTDRIKLIREKIANIYVDLIRLFGYRHKMIWAYQKSQSIKLKIENGYAEIMTCVNAITQISVVGAKHSGDKSLPPTNNLSAGMLRPETIDSQSLPPTNNSSTVMLRPDTTRTVAKNQDKLDLNVLESNLKTSLNILSHYAKSLHLFKAQGGTIKVNLENYDLRLKQLENKDKDNNDKNLSFLSNFSEFSQARYQGQITEDYDNLSPGLTLLENLIRTIEGIIEIEQTKSDRALNTTIFIASTGLAASGVTATLVSTQVYSPQNDKNTMDLLMAIGLSVVIPALVILLVVKFSPRFRPRL